MISRFFAVLVPGLIVLACGSDRPAISSQACAIDTIEGASGTPASTAVGTRLTIKGWAADTKSKRTGKEVIVRLVSQSGVIVASGERTAVINRPDVAKHFKIPEIEPSGFHADVETKGVSPGTLEIMIESRFDTHVVACLGNQTVTLK